MQSFFVAALEFTGHVLHLSVLALYVSYAFFLHIAQGFVPPGPGSVGTTLWLSGCVTPMASARCVKHDSAAAVKKEMTRIDFCTAFLLHFQTCEQDTTQID
jgi:hypothetical protein